MDNPSPQSSSPLGPVPLGSAIQPAAATASPSIWRYARIGISSVVLLIAIIFAIARAVSPSNGTRLAVGDDEIFYSGSATKADAQALGKALTDIGYFNKTNSITVLLAKDAAGTTLKFVVKEDAGQKDSTLDEFAIITQAVAPSIGGKPITLKLLSAELKELKSRKVE